MKRYQMRLGGAELPGSKSKLHAGQVGVIVRGRAVDDQGARLEGEQTHRLTLAIGRFACCGSYLSRSLGGGGSPRA